jgi:transcriptional regulator with XRE-family HTH domain
MASKSNEISTISENIKKARNKKGVSQDRLSKMADVAYNTIIKIEGGKNDNPTLDTLKKIAKALNISIDELTS